MLKVEINKENGNPVVQASGNIMEILNDIAVMTSALYTQFQAADPNTAHYFRTGFINMTNDPDSPMWKALGNQTGIAYRK